MCRVSSDSKACLVSSNSIVFKIILTDIWLTLISHTEGMAKILQRKYSTCLIAIASKRAILSNKDGMTQGDMKRHPEGVEIFGLQLEDRLCYWIWGTANLLRIL